METERKFLVLSLPEDLSKFKYHEIEQSYISVDPVIRIRKQDSDFFLTIKGKGSISREEFELKITKVQYSHLKTKTEGNEIKKRRYLIPLENNLTAELDIFGGNLTGLTTVEVEFESLEDAQNFNPPQWFGKDVSLDKQYKNANLALFGIKI